MDYKEIKSAKEIITGFNTKYYEDEVKKIEKRLDNLESGIDEYHGIYSSNSNKRLTDKEREKRISEVKKELEMKNRQYIEARNAIEKLKDGLHELEEITKEVLLYRSLNYFISTLNDESNEKAQAIDLYNNRYKKLYFKSHELLKDKTSEIQNTVKKTLLKIAENKTIVKGFSDINLYLSDTGYDIDNLYSKLSLELEDEYRHHLGEFGVDVERINEAHKKINSNELEIGIVFYDEINRRYQYLEYFNKNYSFKNSNKFLQLEQQYKDIFLLSRQVWYIKEVLDSYESTDISNSKMYQGLQKLAEKKESDLYKMKEKADKNYQSLEIEKIMINEKRLRTLYKEIEELNPNIDSLKIYKIKYEMNEILEQYPELNRPEYHKYIEKKVKEVKEKYDSDDLQQSTLKTEETSEYSKRPNITRADTPSYDEADKEVELDSLKQIEIPDDIQIVRSSLYQKYLMEKLKKTELGKIPFSNYIEKVAPHAKDLIKIEKKIEQQAHTVYKEYLKYFASLEDKSYAMKFSDFALKKYRIPDMDIPIEYTVDEEKGRKL